MIPTFIIKEWRELVDMLKINESLNTNYLLNFLLSLPHNGVSTLNPTLCVSIALNFF